MKFTNNPFVSAMALSLVVLSSSDGGTIWDGGQTTGSIKDGIDRANNWNGNVVNALNGTTAAEFSTAGTEAVINVNASFTGVTINSAATFAITNGTGSLTIGSGGVTVTLPSTTGITHTISESSLILGANQNWSVTNKTGLAQLNVSSVISGSGLGINKTGDGTLQLSGANTYTGATTIKAGTLQLLTGGSLASLSIIVGDTGSTGAVLDAITSGLIVASGQTVSGIGTIKGSTTIQSGGVISPGNSAGILTNLGNISLDPNSTFQAEINGIIAGTGYDQLNVTGATSTATLAGMLSVTTGFTPTTGSLFFLVDNDGPNAISGVFSNASINGNTYTFGSQQYAISYFGDYGTTSFTGGNDVVLMAVPEPGAALLGGLGVLLLLRRRRNG